MRAALCFGPALVMAAVTAYVVARDPHATMLVGRRVSFIPAPVWMVTTVATCIAGYFGLDYWYRIDEEDVEASN